MISFEELNVSKIIILMTIDMQVYYIDTDEIPGFFQ